MGEPETDVHLYWASGCTSCLNAKEFLIRNNVPFVSHNIIEEEGALDELEDRGLPRRVPVIIRGDESARGEKLEAVAEVVGIEGYENAVLPVEELRARLNTILDATQHFLIQLPEGEMETELPNRPRSYGELVHHIFNIANLFLTHAEGAAALPDEHKPEPNSVSKTDLSRYGQDVQRRISEWFESSAQTQDWSYRVEVHYGNPTIHEYLERTTWHTGQHTRQLQWVLEEQIQVDFDSPLTPDLWVGLPMPDKVWDTKP